MDIKQKFWLKVKQIRKEQGISQEKLAEKSRLHRTYIWMIERGERNVTIENIEKVAKALGVSIQDLFSNK